MVGMLERRIPLAEDPTAALHLALDRARVLEENLREVTTLSVGHIAVDSLMMTYYGTQRRVQTTMAVRSMAAPVSSVCAEGGKHWRR